jgi:hypothetical protein
MFYVYMSLVMLFLLAFTAFSGLMLVDPKQLGIWWIENVVMRFNKSYAEAQKRFMEESPWASKAYWIWRVGGAFFIFVSLSMIGVTIKLLWNH